MLSKSASSKLIFILTVSFFILGPKPGGIGTQVSLGVYLLLCIGLTLAYCGNFTLPRTQRHMLALAFMLALITSASFFLSFFFSRYSIGYGEINALLRPIVFFTVFTAGLVVATQMSIQSKEATDAFKIIALVFISTQIPFIIANIVGYDGFNAIYSDGKSKSLETGLRVVGTLGNPNFFGLFSCFLSFSTLLTENKNKLDWLIYLLLTTFIILSGSKSALVIFITVSFLLLVLRSGGLSKKKIIYIISFLIICCSIVLFVYQNQKDFRYISTLFELTEGGKLANLKSIADRQEIWTSAANLFNYTIGDSKYLFGLGPIPELNSLDNDYLYSYFRWGILGSLSFYFLWLYFFYASIKNGKSNGLLFGVFIAFVLVGLQAETFSSLIYGIGIIYMLPTMAKVT